MNELRIEHLGKTFPLSKAQRKSKGVDSGVLVAVDDLSFAPRPGEIFGLLGPNGAGKTTTLRMIATVIRPSAGKILYGGKDIAEAPEEYRRRIGFLTSELKLDDFFTPDYTFTYMASLYGMGKEEIEKRKALLFEEMGVTPFKDSKIKSLSTGMKQKVSLAVSLAHDPEVIIFDEPTNGLDIIAAKAVEDYLRSLRAQGKTILISTHIFSLIEKLCDRVLILLDGKKCLEGELSRLTAEKSLEELFFALYQDKKGGEE